MENTKESLHVRYRLAPRQLNSAVSLLSHPLKETSVFGAFFAQTRDRGYGGHGPLAVAVICLWLGLD